MLSETFKNRHQLTVINTGGQTYIGYIENGVTEEMVDGPYPKVVMMQHVWQVVMMQRQDRQTGQVSVTPAPMPIHKAKSALLFLHVDLTGASWYFPGDGDAKAENDWEADFKKVEEALVKMRASEAGIQLAGANEILKS